MYHCNLRNYVGSTSKIYYLLMATHRNEFNSKFKCGMTNCFGTFKTFLAFDTHISRCHQKFRSKHNYVSSLNLCCNMKLCNKSFSNASHLISHLISGGRIQCCFDHCTKFFKLKSSFSSHITRHHLSRNRNLSPQFF